MAGSIYDWSITAASNATADGDINWAEGQAPSTVNNSARQLQARIAEFIKDTGGTITATGTANAILVTANSSFTTYATGRIVAFKAAASNTAAATLSVNSIGAKSVRKFTANGEAALSGAEIQQGGVYVVMYDATLNAASGGWHLINPSTVSLGPNATVARDDDGAALGPLLTLLRNSASPAANDFIGSVEFNGKDSAGGTDTYARIFAIITDPTSGTEDGDLYFQTVTNGGAVTTFALAGNQARFLVPVVPTVDDGASLGTTTRQWSDLFLAADGAIKFNNSISIAQLGLSMTFTGATSYFFDRSLHQMGTGSLGSSSFSWQSLYIASGGNVNFGGTDVYLQHTPDTLTFNGASSGYVFDAFVVGSIQIPVAGSFNAGAFSATGATRGMSIDGTNLLRSSVEFASTGNHLQFFNSAGGGAFVGRITTAATATAYNTSSDELWKKFLGVYAPSEALAIIREDPTREFLWKTDGTRAVGWGAQTSYAVSKDLATPGGWIDKTTGLPCDEHDENAEYIPWGVDMAKRTPYLWAVVPWLADRLDAAEATITALEARLSAAGL